jgi:hypothetical protein
MFNCSMCKEEFQDPPAMINATGKYCAGCKGEINARSVNTRKHRHVIRTRVPTAERACIWCGSAGPFHKCQEDTATVCKVCHTHRQWLLKCIRYSDKAAHYVAKREATELPLRQEREAQAAALRDQARKASEAKADALVTGGELGMKPAVQVLQVLREPMLDTAQIDRLARVEAMLQKLTAALGGV